MLLQPPVRDSAIAGSAEAELLLCCTSLCWHLFGDGFSDTAAEEFWKRATPVEVGDVSVLILEATDRLFYTCVAGSAIESAPRVSHLADAMMILNSSGSNIDWNRLLILALKFQFVCSLRSALLQLHNLLNAPFPSQ